MTRNSERMLSPSSLAGPASKALAVVLLVAGLCSSAKAEGHPVKPPGESLANERGEHVPAWWDPSGVHLQVGALLAQSLGFTGRLGVQPLGSPSMSPDGATWLRYEPTMDGHPICGVTYVASVQPSGRLGRLSIPLRPSPEALKPRREAISPDRAAEVALRFKEDTGARDPAPFSSSLCWWVEASSLSGDEAVASELRLVHRVTTTDADQGVEVVSVDAATGEVVDAVDPRAYLDVWGFGYSANRLDRGDANPVSVPTFSEAACLGSEDYGFSVIMKFPPRPFTDLCNLSRSFGDGQRGFVEDWLIDLDDWEFDRDWAGSPTAETAGVEAAYGMVSYQEMLRNIFGMDSPFFDTAPPGGGILIEVRAALNPLPMAPSYGSFWHGGNTLSLYDPSMAETAWAQRRYYSFFVIGHEMGHGLLWSLLGDPGGAWDGTWVQAAEEFYADVYGAALELYIDGVLQQPGADPYQFPVAPEIDISPTGLVVDFSDSVVFDSGGPILSYDSASHSDPAHPDWADYRGMAVILSQAFSYLANGIPRFETDRFVPRSWQMVPWGFAGLGNDAAIRIAHRSLFELAYPFDYPKVRSAFVLAAEDLYGVASDEARAVQDAFYAVGIGERAAREPVLEIQPVEYQKETVEISFRLEDENALCCAASVRIWDEERPFEPDLVQFPLDLDALPFSCAASQNEVFEGTRREVSCFVEKALFNEAEFLGLEVIAVDGGGLSSTETSSFRMDYVPPQILDVSYLEEPEANGGILEWEFSETEGTKVTRMVAAYFRNGFSANVVHDGSNNATPPDLDRVRFEISEWDGQLPIAGPALACDLESANADLGTGATHICSFYPDLLQVVHGLPLLEHHQFSLSVVATDIYGNEARSTLGPFLFDRQPPEVRAIWNGGWDRLNNPDFNEIHFDFHDSTCLQSFELYSKGRWGDPWQFRRRWDNPSDCREPNAEPKARLETLVVEPDAEFFGLDAAYFMVVVNDRYFAERLTYKQVELLREDSDEPQCNETIVSGGPEGLEPMVIEMGSPDFSSVVHFQPFEVPDKLRIWQDNKLRFSSGCVANDPDGQINDSWDPTPLALTFDSWPDARDSFIEVEIDGDCDGHDTGTAWEFMVECPQ